MALGIRYITEQEGGHQQARGFLPHTSLLFIRTVVCLSLCVSANYKGSIVQKGARYGAICQSSRCMIQHSVFQNEKE